MNLVRRLALGCAVLTLLAFAAGAGADDASQDGAKDADEGLAPPLTMQWSNNLPWRPLIAWRSSETSRPVVDGDRAYVGSARGRAVFAINTSNGHTIWRKPLPGRVESTVAVGDGRLYVGDSKGWLMALDLADGRTIWKENLQGVILGDILFDEGTLYLLTADNRLHARNAGTGEERWVYRHEVPTGITIYGASSPILHEGRVLAGFSDGTVIAVRRTDGGAAWSQRLVRQGRFRDIDSHPLVHDGRVYVSAYNGKLFCLNADNGVEIWSDEPGGTTGVTLASTSAGEMIVYGTDGGEVVARGIDDGHIKWRYKIRHGLPNTPVARDGLVWVASTNGPLFALNAATGSLQWKFDPWKLSGFSTPVVLDGNQLFAMSNSGTLFKLVPRKGTTLKFQMGRDKSKSEEAPQK